MKPVRGKATLFGKERERIYTHYFVGGNTLVTEMLGSEAHSKLAEEMLRFAATIEFHPPQTLAAGHVNKVRVRVTNVGAGHKLPTGFPEGREMWVDFEVINETGEVLYRSGAVKNGQTEEGTQSFKVVLGDKNGKVVALNVFDADRVLYDTRLEPKGSRDVEHLFNLPAGLSGKAQIVADLKMIGGFHKSSSIA